MKGSDPGIAKKLKYSYGSYSGNETLNYFKLLLRANQFKKS